MNIFNDGLFIRNPHRIMNHGDDKKDLRSSFGGIIARAGTGKTALIVQLAIDSLLKDVNVLHISLNEQLDKVNTWYKEVLNNIVLDLSKDVNVLDEIWDLIQVRRFIMTFKTERFEVPILMERLEDLTSQNIFKPSVVIIDGLEINPKLYGIMKELKKFSKKYKIHIWFTVMMHRCEKLTIDGFPFDFSYFTELFEDIVRLKPNKDKVYIESLKGNLENIERIKYFLDPSSMLIKDC